MALTVEQLEIEILNLSNEARTKLAQRLLQRLDAIADDIELKKVLSALIKWRKPATNPASINRHKALDEKNSSEESPPKQNFWQALQIFYQEVDIANLYDEDIFTDVRDRSPGREVKL